MQYRAIRPFDPWKVGGLCTCPFKYTVNPYTGCSHACLYCYASSYIRDAFNPRPKSNLLENISKDLRNIPKGSIINISSSSDPYIPLEEETQLTRRILERIIGNYVVEIVTKSDLVIRDINLLKKGKSVVSITVTTLNERLASIIEPGAPEPSRRIKAMKQLSENGIPVILRLDPLLPFLTDDEENIKRVIEVAAEAGVKHIISSTYKVKRDNLSRILSSFPDLSEKYKEVYFKNGEKIHGSYYAPKKYRESILLKVKEEAKRHGLTFATCREELQNFNDKNISCDGTSLVKNVSEVSKMVESKIKKFK